MTATLGDHPAELTEALWRRVERLLFDYADRIDDDRLEEWVDLFLPEASYRVVARENCAAGRPLALISCPDKRFLQDRIMALRNATVYSPMVYRHVFGPWTADRIDDGDIDVRANYAVYRTMEDGATAVFSVGRLELTVRDVDGEFKLAGAIVTYDTGLIPGAVVLPL